MEFKITKCLSSLKEELPPINRPTRLVSNQIIKSHKESINPPELFNKIDPLVLVAQYEREINRMKINHSQMLDDLHKELELLRSKNRDLLDKLILMNGGNYCCKHLEELSYEILKSNANDNQKKLDNIIDIAKMHQISTEDVENYNYKKELPELVTVRNTFLSKNVETKSNSHLQDRLNKCNRLIDVLRKENLQQKSELSSLKSLLDHGLKISGVGLDSSSIRKNLKSSTRILSSLSHPTISYLDIVSSKKNLHSVSGSE